MAQNNSLGGIGKMSELKSRLLFLLGALIIFRLGAHIPVPGIDPLELKKLFDTQSGGILGMFNMFSGGALSRFTVFALGIMPYISASIIMTLLTSMNARLKDLKKEGQAGQRIITSYTRQATVFLATFQALGISVALESQPGLVLDPGLLFRLTAIVTLVSGTMFLVWLGEQITERGIGNGISMIIMAGIVAGLPSALGNTLELTRTGAFSIPLVFFLIIAIVLVTAVVVFVERGQRRITINYAKRQVGNKMYGGQSSHLPLKINTAGVIPAIFASALLLLPVTLANFGFSDSDTFINISSMFTQGQPLYMLLYASGIIFFSFFYTSIVFNPKETAENLRKYGGFIPGIRPGERSAEYIETILNRLTTIGAMYLTFVCLLPEFLISKYPIPFYLGGTSILIVVVVAMDTVTQVQTRMMSSQYESLIKKSKFGK